MNLMHKGMKSFFTRLVTRPQSTKSSGPLEDSNPQKTGWQISKSNLLNTVLMQWNVTILKYLCYKIKRCFQKHLTYSILNYNNKLLNYLLTHSCFLIPSHCPHPFYPIPLPLPTQHQGSQNCYWHKGHTNCAALYEP